MPALSQSRLLRLITFGALYLAQGLPWGFIGTGYAVFLADQGLSNEAMGGAMALAYLPWSFKVLAGPFLDRVANTRFGRRRPFIIGAELLMGLSLLALVPIDPAKNLALFSWVIFAHNVAAALQDVAVDGLAVDLLQDDERGRANSIMWASKSAGVALGGGGGLLLAKAWGWSGLFITLAIVLWAIMAIPILLRERTPEEQASPEAGGRLELSTLWRSFSFGLPWLGVAIGLIAPAGYALIGTPMLRLLRVDLALSEERIAFLAGTVDPLSGIAGALLGGFIADRIGLRRTMALGMTLIGTLLAVWALTPDRWGDWTWLVAWETAFQVSIYLYGAASLGFFMGMANPAIGATQFSLFMATTNLTYAWTGPVGGRIADDYGLVMLFGVAAAVQVAAIGLLPFADPEKARAHYLSAPSATGARTPPAG